MDWNKIGVFMVALQIVCTLILAGVAVFLEDGVLGLVRYIFLLILFSIGSYLITT